MKRFYVLVLCFFPLAVLADTEVIGPIDGEEWCIDDSPYVLVGDIVVHDLTICPGVEVFAGGNYKIDVVGVLIARGAPADSIRFGVQDGVTGWKGLRFDGAIDGSVLEYCTIADSDERGLLIVDCRPTIVNCKFADNSTTGGGAGVWLDISSEIDLTFADCEFSNNWATNEGGGVYAMIDSGSVLRFERCQFTGNGSRGHNGGGLRLVAAGGEIQLVNCLFEGNRANVNNAWANRVGGGFHVSGNGRCIVENCDIVGNTTRGYCTELYCRATGRGGGIYSSCSELELRNCVLEGNVSRAQVNSGYSWRPAEAYGGGLYVASGTVVASNLVIGCNGLTAIGNDLTRQGGGVYVHGGTVTLDNCSLALNDYQGIFNAGGTVDVRNSILWENAGGNTQYGGAVTFTYCDVQELENLDNGNIDEHPGFWFMDGCEDLRLGSLSPCIDAGDPNPSDNDCFFEDHGYESTDPPFPRGEDRNDMGAFGGPGSCIWGSNVPDNYWGYVGIRAVDLTARVVGGGVDLNWSLELFDTTTDVRVLATTGDAEWVVLHQTADGRRFTARDESPHLVDGVTVVYSLLVGWDGGPLTVVASESLGFALPAATFELLGATPNPFNPRTSIVFTLKRTEDVAITVHDLTGRRIADVARGTYPAGQHAVEWTGRDDDNREVASGTYFARMLVSGRVRHKKIAVLR